ncbi:unnamed protein product [Sphenostylis stenocarpa]|uniref:legumain n=1 Tax=Sphenostylis stenocarpa TaxID=92480 RepID=A0AA86RUP1_9FABA|nr:unnamed protein product [Sphenostylis stenocarpa]
MQVNIGNWVTLMALLWIGFSVSVLEGVANPLKGHGKGKHGKGKRWAVLVAGSMGYQNYRHQADVCHAYQVLKKGGLKDENIIVFMYDDIANHTQNPRRGIIINKPNGPDVYKGVPKDYTGDAANKNNFFAVISGNRSALSGGSGKVVNSGPRDTIFIYYADHGSTGFIGMPVGMYVMAHEFVKVLKAKHAAKSYKKMVIYMEACEAGSMFDGILPNNLNIFVTTASNPKESSFAFYCPDSYPPAPPHYTTCLGDAYSIAWLEDSSHVMQYGDMKFNNDFLATYIGAPPYTSHNENAYSFEPSTQTRRISQRDAHLLHLKLELQEAPDGSDEKMKAQKKLDGEISHRESVDKGFHLIGDLLFGEENSSTMMLHVRPPGQPLVDDWDCFKTLINTYESVCGTLSSYGRKYTRAFANMCNAGISVEQLKAASLQWAGVAIWVMNVDVGLGVNEIVGLGVEILDGIGSWALSKEFKEVACGWDCMHAYADAVSS